MEHPTQGPKYSEAEDKQDYVVSVKILSTEFHEPRVVITQKAINLACAMESASDIVGDNFELTDYNIHINITNERLKNANKPTNQPTPKKF